MQKKRLPIFHRVPNLIKLPISLSKMRKPVITKLIFLKKSRKLIKRFIFFDHCKYNYGFLDHELYHEFSPSRTPLFHRYQRKFRKCAGYRGNLYSLSFLCKCLGGSEGDKGEDECPLPLETLFPASVVPADEHLQRLDFEDEHESVDLRAERFIQWFYQEMRSQRRESF